MTQLLQLHGGIGRHSDPILADKEFPQCPYFQRISPVFQDSPAALRQPEEVDNRVGIALSNFISKCLAVMRHCRGKTVSANKIYENTPLKLRMGTSGLLCFINNNLNCAILWKIAKSKFSSRQKTAEKKLRALGEAGGKPANSPRFGANFRRN